MGTRELQSLLEYWSFTMKYWGCLKNKTVAHRDLENHLAIVYIMLHEIHEERLQTKMKRQKQQLHLCALTKWQMVTVAMQLCTFRANKHFCTYGEQIYALTCGRVREGISVLGTALSLSGTSLRAWQQRSGALWGVMGNEEGVLIHGSLPFLLKWSYMPSINLSNSCATLLEREKKNPKQRGKLCFYFSVDTVLRDVNSLLLLHHSVAHQSLVYTWRKACLLKLPSETEIKPFFWNLLLEAT